MNTPRIRRKAVARAVTLALAASSLVLAGDAAARITKIVLDSGSPSLAFGGADVPGVGKYYKITGWAYGELNPRDPLNRVIVDIENAPLNARRNVEYSFNFYILTPVDKTKSAHRAMYEPPNRGGKTSNNFLRLPTPTSAQTNDPASSTNAANGFLTTRGWTMMYSGWDFSAGKITTDPYRAVINLPVAHTSAGKTITGPGYEYFTGNGGTSLALNYPPASSDKSGATLTHRVHLNDPPVAMDPSSWDYNADGTAVVLNNGATYTSQDIYEFTYTAKDPTVNGIGFAAVRDFNSFMKYETQDDYGNPNPLAGDIQKIYTYIVSQPGRLLNDYRNLGMNEDESHRKVLDGIVNWISAGDGINMNLRFSQPGRTERNRQDELYAEGVFPFAQQATFDPITHKIAGRYDRCTASSTCPLGMEIYSSNEYWVKAASLLHTTPDGTSDLPDFPLTRNYFISSHQHGTGNGASRGSCQQFQNPLDSTPIHRALMIAMDQWATNGTLPPPSAVPSLAGGTMGTPQQVGFPTNIPNPFWTGSTIGTTHDEPNQFVTYTGLKTTRYRYNYGVHFDQGIMDINPPVHFAPYEDNPLNGPIYPSYVPKVDADGNDIAGVHMAEVTVPVATYTGWALRNGAQANDGCEGSGQWVRFPNTEAARAASNDPRPSVQLRYGTDANYKAQFSGALDGLITQRLLLPEDKAAAMAKMPASNIP
jgi:hypothetical protein